MFKNWTKEWGKDKQNSMLIITSICTILIITLLNIINNKYLQC